jgi:hypothetical protein
MHFYTNSKLKHRGSYTHIKPVYLHWPELLRIIITLAYIPNQQNLNYTVGNFAGATKHVLERMASQYNLAILRVRRKIRLTYENG